jgi:hypothetical protein
MIIKLTFPDAGIFPNGRLHPKAKARLVRKHRELAFFATLTAMGVAKVPTRILHKDAKLLGITNAGRNSAFYQRLSTLLHPADPPVFTGYSLHFRLPHLRHDDDGLEASFKAYRDGIADALRVNDKTLRKIAATFIKDKKQPGIEVELTNCVIRLAERKRRDRGKLSNYLKS